MHFRNQICSIVTFQAFFKVSVFTQSHKPQALYSCEIRHAGCSIIFFRNTLYVQHKLCTKSKVTKFNSDLSSFDHTPLQKFIHAPSWWGIYMLLFHFQFVQLSQTFSLTDLCHCFNSVLVVFVLMSCYCTTVCFLCILSTVCCTFITTAKLNFLFQEQNC